MLKPHFIFLRGRIMQNKVIDFAELSHIGVILDKIAA
jgi:hypothetical protein